MFVHTYRNSTRDVNHKISKVPKSGINKKINKRMEFITIKLSVSCFGSLVSRFFNNQYDKKKTYQILKNSDGCIFEIPGIDIHHLAQFKTIPTQGTKTSSCKSIKTTPISIILVFFWKNFSGTIYTAKAAKLAINMFFNCLKK